MEVFRIGDIGDRIRGMTQFCDEEIIAKAVGMPVDIVRGVILGEITDDVLENYNPAKPPDIRIVEQKKYIRSRTVGIISPGGNGATTLVASLAITLAKRIEQSIACIDLNENGLLPCYLNLAPKRESIPAGLNIVWDDWKNGSTKDYKNHPAIKNLYLFSPSLTLQKHNELSVDKLNSILINISKEFIMTLVDCPSAPRLWPGMIQNLDLIILVIRADMLGVHYLKRLVPLIETNKDRCVVVLSSDREYHSSMSELLKAIRDTENIEVVGNLPYEPTMNKVLANNGLLLFRNGPYSESIKKIADIFYPVKEKGEKGLFKRMFG